MVIHTKALSLLVDVAFGVIQGKPLDSARDAIKAAIENTGAPSWENLYLRKLDGAATQLGEKHSAIGPDGDRVAVSHEQGRIALHQDLRISLDQTALTEINEKFTAELAVALIAQAAFENLKPSLSEADRLQFARNVV